MADVFEQIASRIEGRGMPFSAATILKNSDLTPSVQKHLLRVYLALTLGLVMAGAGAWSGIAFNLSQPLVPSLAFIGLATWLSMTPATPANANKRLGLFAGVAGANGLTMAPLVGFAANVAPGVLLTALGGTAVVFACFSLSALLARRRSYLYLAGVLSSALSFMFWSRMALSFFGRSLVGFEAEMWVGLAVFVGYVLVDTQVIVEKASNGERDYVGHALQLFLDFVAVFVRILVLLLKSQKRKESRSRKSRRSD